MVKTPTESLIKSDIACFYLYKSPDNSVIGPLKTLNLIKKTEHITLTSVMPVSNEHKISTAHQNINTLNIYLVGILTFIRRKISCSFELSITNVLNPSSYKNFTMLNSTEHEISTAHQNINT